MIRTMKLSLLFPVLCLLSLLFLGWKALPWEFSAKLFPLCLVGVSVVLLSIHVVRELWRPSSPSQPQAGEQIMDIGILGDEDPSVLRWRSLEIWAWLMGFLITILTVGMLIAIPLFPFLYLKFHAKERWPVSILIPLLVTGFMYGLFEVVLHTPWIEGWLWDLW